MDRVKAQKHPKMERQPGNERTCPMSLTKELQNSTNWLPTHTVQLPRTTGKKITRQDTSIPNKL